MSQNLPEHSDRRIGSSGFLTSAFFVICQENKCLDDRFCAWPICPPDKRELDDCVYFVAPAAIQGARDGTWPT
jgi:hypothetical protein